MLGGKGTRVLVVDSLNRLINNETLISLGTSGVGSNIMVLRRGKKPVIIDGC